MDGRGLMLLQLMIGLHVDDGGDIDDGTDENDVGCLLLGQVLLSMMKIAVDDDTGTSRLVWHKLLAVDVGLFLSHSFENVIGWDCH